MKRNKVIGIGILVGVAAVGYLYWSSKNKGGLQLKGLSGNADKPLNAAERAVQKRLDQIKAWKAKRLAEQQAFEDWQDKQKLESVEEESQTGSGVDDFSAATERPDYQYNRWGY